MILKCWTIKTLSGSRIHFKSELEESEVNIFEEVDINNILPNSTLNGLELTAIISIPSKIETLDTSLSDDQILDDFQHGKRNASIDLTKPVDFWIETIYESDRTINKARDNIIDPILKAFNELSENVTLSEHKVLLTSTERQDKSADQNKNS